MVNANYVKVGRLVKINRGPRADKIGIITAIVDSNRVLLENPEEKKMWRHVQSVKNIEPSKFAVKIQTNASTKDVKAALAKKKVIDAWNKTGKAKAIAAKQALAASSEFERYQLRVAKRQRASLSRKLFKERDAKEKISLNAINIAKIEKKHNKLVDKKMKERHDRIKKYAAKKKAKRAGKGKNAGKK